MSADRQLCTPVIDKRVRVLRPDDLDECVVGPAFPLPQNPWTNTRWEPPDEPRQFRNDENLGAPRRQSWSRFEQIANVPARHSPCADPPRDVQEDDDVGGLHDVIGDSVYYPLVGRDERRDLFVLLVLRGLLPSLSPYNSVEAVKRQVE